MHKTLFSVLFSLSASFFVNVLEAQNIIQQDKIKPIVKDTANIKSVSINGVQQKDLFDLVGQLLHKDKKNKKPEYKKDTITSKPVYSFLPAIGYTLETETAFIISGNIAFRMDSTARISVIATSLGYTQNKQATFPIESEIWTKNNRWEFVGDDRFYKYPQSTFGLGSASSLKDENPMDYFYVRLYEAVYRHITGDLFAGGGYIVDYRTGISQKGTLDGAPSDYTNYGVKTHTVSSGFTLNGLYDTRDNPVYTESGVYSAVQYRSSYTALGSTYKWSSLILDVRKYIKWPADTHNVLALWSYDWLVLSGHPPYLDLPATGWDPFSDTGRGYIQGRFRGAQEVYAEAEYRFGLTRNGLLGGVFFLNGSSFSAAPGTALQAIQPGFGPGIRIKLNKISKTNVSIDYGLGRQGSRGLYINVGELF